MRPPGWIGRDIDDEFAHRAMDNFRAFILGRNVRSGAWPVAGKRCFWGRLCSVANILFETQTPIIWSSQRRFTERLRPPLTLVNLLGEKEVVCIAFPIEKSFVLIAVRVSFSLAANSSSTAKKGSLTNRNTANNARLKGRERGCVGLKRL